MRTGLNFFFFSFFFKLFNFAATFVFVPFCELLPIWSSFLSILLCLPLVQVLSPWSPSFLEKNDPSLAHVSVTQVVKIGVSNGTGQCNFSGQRDNRISSKSRYGTGWAGTVYQNLSRDRTGHSLFFSNDFLF